MVRYVNEAYTLFFIILKPDDVSSNISQIPPVECVQLSLSGSKTEKDPPSKHINMNQITEKQYKVLSLQEIKLNLVMEKLELEKTKLNLELHKLGHES